MESVNEKGYITCSSCSMKFERDKEFRHCSNCFACTGCEIYYCPGCDNEIVITPVKSISRRPDQKGETGKGRKYSKGKIN
jgi:hypothetical protein